MVVAKKLSLTLSLVLLISFLSACGFITDRSIVHVGAQTFSWQELYDARPEGELRPLARETYTTDSSKLLYDTLLQALHTGSGSISLFMSQDEYNQTTGALDQILSDVFIESVMLPANNIPSETWSHSYNPLSGRFVLEIPPLLLAESARYLEQYNEALAVACALLETLIPAGTGEYETAYIIYQYIITHTIYTQYRQDEPEKAACTAWDMLTQGKAQCEGFAKAFGMLAALSGIESSVVTCDGTRDRPGHAWNLVRLDGEYYYLDCTNAAEEETDFPAGMKDYGFCMSEAYMQTVPSYEYDQSRSPAFSENVRLRDILPLNEGSRLSESPYYIPNANLSDGADTVREAFKECLQSGRNWIWVTGEYDEFLASGLFEENREGSLIQNITEELPEGYILHWEWTDKMSLFYLQLTPDDPVKQKN